MGSPAADKRAAQRTADRVVAMARDPRLFLKYAFYTVDETDAAAPVKRYPYAEKEYLRATVDAWLAQPLNIIQKSRGVMASWTMCGLHLHLAFSAPYRKVFVVAKDFRFAEQLRKQMLGAYGAIPDAVWPKELRPPVYAREGELIFMYGEHPDAVENSRIITVPSGEDVLRGYTGTAIWFDEAAFHWEFESTFKASKSTARNNGRITITSTHPSVATLEDPPLYWKLLDDDIESFWEKGLDADKAEGLLTVDPKNGTIRHEE